MIVEVQDIGAVVCNNGSCQSSISANFTSRTPCAARGSKAFRVSSRSVRGILMWNRCAGGVGVDRRLHSSTGVEWRQFHAMLTMTLLGNFWPFRGGTALRPEVHCAVPTESWHRIYPTSYSAVVKSSWASTPRQIHAHRLSNPQPALDGLEAPCS